MEKAKMIENSNVQSTGTLAKINSSAKEFKNGILNPDKSMGEMAHQFGEKIGDISSQAVDSTRDIIHSSQEYINKNPIRVVAIAAVTGMALGSLFTLSMRRRS